MPQLTQTNHIRKFCGCARGKWSACPHAWYLDIKAPKDHPGRPDQRYRKNLDLILGYHPATLSEAGRQAGPVIEAWLSNRDPREIQPADRPTVAQTLTQYGHRSDVGRREHEQVKPITETMVLGRPFGTYRLAELTPDLLEAFQTERPVVAGNRNLDLLRAMCRWAVRKGLLEQTPFRIGNVSVVSLRTETARSRRLQGDEADRLILEAGSLGPLIIGALETGCRLGELLSLQWSQVRFTPRAELFLPAQKTKAKKDRRIPISTALNVVLHGRRLDPAGAPLAPDAFVFGNEIGRRRRSIKTAWRLTCRRAKITDLHFHDLRREAGSRWMDAGVPLATIQRWLGHHNISQTSTYLSASLGADADDMRVFEERIGRVPASAPLPQVATDPGTDGAEPTPSSAARDDSFVHDTSPV